MLLRRTALVDQQQERILAVCGKEVLRKRLGSVQAAHFLVEPERKDDLASRLETLLEESLDGGPVTPVRSTLC